MDRCRPTLGDEARAVVDRAEPVVGDEVDQLAVVVEDELGAHRLGAVGERGADVVVVDRLPVDRCVHEGSGSEQAEVVEQRDRLALVHLGARGVDHRDQRAQFDAIRAEGPVKVWSTSAGRPDMVASMRNNLAGRGP